MVARGVCGLQVLMPSLFVIIGFFGVLVELISVAGGLVLFAGAVLFPLVYPWVLRRILRRSVAYLCGPVTIRVTDDGYECVSERYTQSMRWAMFERVVATREFWLFHAGGRPTAFLPLSAFDAAQRRRIETMLDQRLAA